MIPRPVTMCRHSTPYPAPAGTTHVLLIKRGGDLESGTIEVIPTISDEEALAELRAQASIEWGERANSVDLANANLSTLQSLFRAGHDEDWELAILSLSVPHFPTS